ncbi:hypothetical protein INN71_02635 [Nocardioides sp. ChNu-153]|uniref:3'-5' exonuclease n=1 Tax=Nocardioides sp. ChNu-153 TaxID=2779364 RepID=UPI002654A10B|nr:hypothetical protein [Nocardioides sp. ChNu-153]MDN7120282.1 hypothetical protein [Nocardioides sp. ChNu-153]
MTRPLVFVDTEPTSLDPSRRPWEVCLIRRAPDSTERTTWVMVEDVDLAYADPDSLRIGGFYDRHPAGSGLAVVQRPGPCRLEVLREDRLARMVERETRGATLVGVNPGFDVHVLDKMLRRHRLAPAWHYWPVDVKSMAIGALHARGLDDLPDSSDALAELCGVTPVPPAMRHTAMGDATWARDWYDRLATGRGWAVGENPHTEPHLCDPTPPPFIADPRVLDGGRKAAGR